MVNPSRKLLQSYSTNIILELLKDKETTNRQLEDDLTNCRKELQITAERLRHIEEDQHAQLTQSESTTNYLERRIHELDKVFITFRKIKQLFFFNQTIRELTLEKQQIMVKYDRELTDLRDTYENQVTLCKKEMQNELDRLTEHHQQLINDEQTRARTKLQVKEQVRFIKKKPSNFKIYFCHILGTSSTI